jgi:hypothetical protein
MGLPRRCTEQSRYPTVFQDSWAKGVHPATACQLCLPWTKVCGWKELFEGAGGTVNITEPYSGGKGPGPSEGAMAVQTGVQHVSIDFDDGDMGLDDMPSPAVPSPVDELSTWEVPPEEEFGMGGTAI